MLTITPPRVSTATFARDVTILLDASGSMSGLPIAWAKDVAAGMLRTLGEGDRFEVIAFSSQPRSLTGGIVPATQRSLTAALDELTRLRASGGTEMASAVVRALQPLRHDAQHQVVLITDGQIGFEHEIVARIVEGLPERARLHTVGVGAAPNRTLTLRAARAGRGVESFVCGDSEVPATIARLNAATARPVLTDIAIASTAIRGVAPARPRDVLAGQPLVVALELAQAGGTIAVSGKLAGSTEPWTWQLTVPPVAAREGAVTKVPLGALYGRELIADFDMSRPGSDDHVRNVALRHRIASRMTSLVAISEEATVDPKAPRRGVVLPVEVPAYMSAEGLGLMSGQGVWDAVFMESRPREDAAEFRAWDVKASLEPRFLDKLLGKFRARAVAPMGTNARVLAVEGNLLVVEIEAPLDGFLCPSGRVVVMAGEQVIGAGTIDPVQSSPRGPHAKGLLLRVAILGTASWLCQAGDEVTVIGGTSA
jgi:Ca-activated chloride channel family protein